jgi:hypothetical protein
VSQIKKQHPRKMLLSEDIMLLTEADSQDLAWFTAA